MDSKLRALKVADLKQILVKANVSFPAKAIKSDLITLINANPRAYAQLHPPDDLLAPPEEVDWNVEPELVADPSPALHPVSTKPPSAKSKAAPLKPLPVPSITTETTTTFTPTEDPELEKRRLRAERFGIPLVEAKQKIAKPLPQKAASGVTTEELEARAKRFGTDDPVSKPNGRKRSAQTEDFDPEELERRKKRSERFGLPVKA